MPDFGDYSILIDGFEFVKKKVVFPDSLENFLHQDCICSGNMAI